MLARASKRLLGSRNRLNQLSLSFARAQHPPSFFPFVSFAFAQTSNLKTTGVIPASTKGDKDVEPGVLKPGEGISFVRGEEEESWSDFSSSSST